MSAHLLQNRTIWLTGASKGLGLAICRQLLEVGCRVYASARTPGELAALQQQYPEHCRFIAVDLTRPEDIAAACQTIGTDTDHLDTLILNAGVCEYATIREFSANPMADVMAVNFTANLHILEAALPLLRNGNRGHIVGISSMVTRLPLPRSEGYGASKAAFDYFLASLRVDLLHEHIDVSIIKPGFIRTPLTDRNDFTMPFIMEADSAAKEVMDTLVTRKFEHRFPWRLRCLMGAVRLLPTGCQLRVLQKLTRHQS